MADENLKHHRMRDVCAAAMAGHPLTLYNDSYVANLVDQQTDVLAKAVARDDAMRQLLSQEQYDRIGSVCKTRTSPLQWSESMTVDLALSASSVSLPPGASTGSAEGTEITAIPGAVETLELDLDLPGEDKPEIPAEAVQETKPLPDVTILPFDPDEDLEPAPIPGRTPFRRFPEAQPRPEAHPVPSTRNSFVVGAVAAAAGLALGALVVWGMRR